MRTGTGPFPSQADSASLDCIVAPATAPGRSAIAILRLSGFGTAAVLGRVFHSPRPPTQLPRTLVLGEVRSPSGQIIDHALAVWFAGPNSFTGEDTAELHLHGGPAIMEGALQACLAAGARLALPGEFTRRAFLNGRLDLAQAEAVTLAISAQTAAAAASAIRLLQGHASAKIRRAYAALIDALAIIEAAIDFPDEDIPPLDHQAALLNITQAQGILAAMLASADRSIARHSGVRVVLAGQPNAGKSSLFNALVGHDRAIVTPHPGTTRDTIEATIDLDGIPVTLIDTAGLRPTTDPIEQEGIRRSQAEIAQGTLILALHEEPYPSDELRQNVESEAGPSAAAVLFVRTKMDTHRQYDTTPVDPAGLPIPPVACSTLSPGGLDELRRALNKALGGEDSLGDSHAESIIANHRQRDAAQSAASAVAAASDVFHRAPMQAELVASHLREALQALSEFLGKDAPEEVLDALFSRFCLGK